MVPNGWHRGRSVPVPDPRPRRVSRSIRFTASHSGALIDPQNDPWVFVRIRGVAVGPSRVRGLCLIRRREEGQSQGRFGASPLNSTMAVICRAVANEAAPPHPIAWRPERRSDWPGLSSERGILLVPTWLLQLGGEPTPMAVAVAERAFLGVPKQPSASGEPTTGSERGQSPIPGESSEGSRDGRLMSQHHAQQRPQSFATSLGSTPRLPFDHSPALPRRARSSEVLWGITCGDCVPCATYW